MSFIDEVKAVTKTKEEAEMEPYIKCANYHWKQLQDHIKEQAKKGEITCDNIDGVYRLSCWGNDFEYTSSEEAFLHLVHNQGVWRLNDKTSIVYKNLKDLANKEGIWISNPFIYGKSGDDTFRELGSTEWTGPYGHYQSCAPAIRFSLDLTNQSLDDQIRFVTRTKEEYERELKQKQKDERERIDNRNGSGLWEQLKYQLKESASKGEISNGIIKGILKFDHGAAITSSKNSDGYEQFGAYLPPIKKTDHKTIDIRDFLGTLKEIKHVYKTTIEPTEDILRAYKILKNLAQKENIWISDLYIIDEKGTEWRTQRLISEKKEDYDTFRFYYAVDYSKTIETKEQKEERRKKELAVKKLREEKERQTKQDADAMWTMLYCVIETEKKRRPDKKFYLGWLRLDKKIVTSNSKNPSETREFSVNLKPHVIEEKTFLGLSTRYMVGVDERTQKAFDVFQKIADEHGVSVTLEIVDSSDVSYDKFPVIVTSKRDNHKTFAYKIRYEFWRE